MIRMVIAHNQPAARAGLRMWLSLGSDLQIGGKAPAGSLPGCKSPALGYASHSGHHFNEEG